MTFCDKYAGVGDDLFKRHTEAQTNLEVENSYLDKKTHNKTLFRFSISPGFYNIRLRGYITLSEHLNLIVEIVLPREFLKIHFFLQH